MHKTLWYISVPALARCLNTRRITCEKGKYNTSVPSQQNLPLPVENKPFIENLRYRDWIQHQHIPAD